MTTYWNYNNRQFIVNASEDGFNGVDILIRELKHPNWPIFKTVLRDSGFFFLEDVESIDEGIKNCIAKLIAREEKDKANAKKWEDFLNSRRKQNDKRT